MFELLRWDRAHRLFWQFHAVLLPWQVLGVPGQFSLHGERAPGD
jgi:hypothetical protein